MTTSLPTGTLVLRKHRGAYQLQELPPAATTPAELRARGGMRRGTITTATDVWSITANDFCRNGATLGSPEAPMVRLDPGPSLVPDGPAQWSIGRSCRGYHGTVSRGNDRITIRGSAFGKQLRVEVVGAWHQLELVVLTACFVVMARRRGDRLRTIAVAGAIGHG